MTTDFLNTETDTNISPVKALVSAVALPTAICLGGIALFWSLPAHAQSFSCASAEKPAEFAICNSENLLTMDEQLGRAFSAKYVGATTSPQRQAVVREHGKWVIKRDACGNDVTCLNLRYKERLDLLGASAS